VKKHKENMQIGKAKTRRKPLKASGENEEDNRKAAMTHMY